MPEALTRKLGPLPRWAWLGLAVAVGLYMFVLRKPKVASEGSTTNVVPQTQTPGLATQAGSPGDNGQATSDTLAALGTQSASLLEALSNTQQAVLAKAQLEAETAHVRAGDELAFRQQAADQAHLERQDVIQAQQVQQSQSNQDVVEAVTSPLVDAISQLGQLIRNTSAGSFVSETQPVYGTDPGSNAPIVVYVNPSTTGNPQSNEPAAAQTAARSSAAASTPDAQPFGGVVSVRTLQNGSTLTTYANGRQVQQAPGHTPYVVRRGG